MEFALGNNFSRGGYSGVPEYICSNNLKKIQEITEIRLLFLKSRYKLITYYKVMRIERDIIGCAKQFEYRYKLLGYIYPLIVCRGGV